MFFRLSYTLKLGTRLIHKGIEHSLFLKYRDKLVYGNVNFSNSLFKTLNILCAFHVFRKVLYKQFIEKLKAILIINKTQLHPCMYIICIYTPPPPKG